MLIVLGVVAFFLMVLGAWRMAIRSGCKTEIQGVFVRYDRTSAPKGGSRYFPVFRYQIRAGECEWRSLDSFVERECPDFIAGQVYPIWVDSQKEKRFVVRKGIGADGIGLLITGMLIGVVLIFVSVFGA